MVQPSTWRFLAQIGVFHPWLSSVTRPCLPSPRWTRLDIRKGKSDTLASRLPYNIEDTQWLVLLRRFANVKDLYIAEPLGLLVMSALAAPAGNGRTVLPALQNIFLEGLQPSGSLRDVVDQLIATRQLLGHSIYVHNWNRRDDKVKEKVKTMQMEKCNQQNTRIYHNLGLLDRKVCLLRKVSIQRSELKRPRKGGGVGAQ